LFRVFSRGDLFLWFSWIVGYKTGLVFLRYSGSVTPFSGFSLFTGLSVFVQDISIVNKDGQSLSRVQVYSTNK